MKKGAMFDIFPCGTHGWCARRADGLVCGYFVDPMCAIRFARRESTESDTMIRNWAMRGL
jgi:hypothetical protein